MSESHESNVIADTSSFAGRVRSAILWRSGSQIIAQLVTWSATFIVIRMLQPEDYGLFAMTQFVIACMVMVNGYGLTSALVQAAHVDKKRVRQIFGILLVISATLATIQFIAAPYAAAYFRAPIVADMLRVQCLIHITSPFILMPQALLSRTIDFRTQARVNIGAALLSAVVGPIAALAGAGVWTLVIAPLTLFITRAIGLAIVGRWLIWPSFDFRGARSAIGFGGIMLVSDLMWFVQTQADVVIGGRVLDPYSLGLYSTALFLSQIIVTKFVPALNDVAFPAYARAQADPAAVARGFLTSIRMVMVIALPFAIGLALTAQPLVAIILGSQWISGAALVSLLAMATPFMTLMVLYAPAVNGIGRPGITARIGLCGAILMPSCFFVGIQFGVTGLAGAWLVGCPILALIASWLALPILGIRPFALFNAMRPGMAASGAMALTVLAIDHLLGAALSPAPRLSLLVSAGILSYGVTLLLLFRADVIDIIALMRRHPPEKG